MSASDECIVTFTFVLIQQSAFIPSSERNQVRTLKELGTCMQRNFNTMKIQRHLVCLTAIIECYVHTGLLDISHDDFLM